MMVSVEDLAAATSILVAVCLAAVLVLVVVCRLLLARHTPSSSSSVARHDDVIRHLRPTEQQCQQQQCTTSVLTGSGSISCRGGAESATMQDSGTGLESSDIATTVARDTATTAEITATVATTAAKTATRSSSIDEAEEISSTDEHTGLLAMQQTSGGARIQRALSCDSVISDTSVGDSDYIDDVIARVGQLEFTLQYKSASSELLVTVIQARDLECDHVTGNLDSYVRVALIYRSTTSKHQTKVVRNTVCPRYTETFCYKIDAASLEPNCTSTPTVQFHVYSCDKYARHRLLGETELRLADIELRTGQSVQLWLNLHEMDQKPVDRGSIMVSLNYLPTAERLILVIVKAQNLCWPSPKPVGDCCVKVYLLNNGKRIAKKKTSYKHEERGPIFNEAMIFSLSQSRIETIQLKISVIVVTPGDCRATSIGHVTLGPHSTGTELVHWTQIMTSFRRPVTMWHTLK